MEQRLSRRQAAIIGAYTGIALGPFEDIHEYIEEIMGGPVFTHQLADADMRERIKEASREGLLALCPVIWVRGEA